jgi:acetylornithine/N-succinyldiaminopimelate aminotransferase
MSYLAKNYNRKKISFKFGKGSFLYSTNGKKYLDFVQGIAVNSLGHAHPKLVNAVNQQSKKLWHVSNAFQIPEGEMLAKKLAKKTFADFVMFQNSGAEATEAAIKVARRYFYSIGKPKKNRILCVKNSFPWKNISSNIRKWFKKND